VEVVDSAKRRRRGWIRCRIGEHLIFDPGRLGTYCLAHWDSRVYDAFVIAAAVQFCDHTKARPSTGWGRNIALRISVHDPELWESDAVSAALHDALNFLTGDKWTITFTARHSRAESLKQQHFNIPDDAPIVMPFSDGLDSHIVAALVKREHGANLIPVRLGSKSAGGTRRGDHKQPFAAVPYRVAYSGTRPRETSARSRGFRFALLSGIAAFLSGTKQIVVPESGQGALAPTLVPVGQAYEDYRNHPLFTDRIEVLLRALFEHTVHYTYPRLWHTKGETLADFRAAFPDDSAWMATRSCWQNQRHVSVDGKMRQCGTCAACMLRRVSIHAANCTEDPTTYVWNNLGAPTFEEGADPAFLLKNPRGVMYEYAVAGTLHLDHFAGLIESSTNRAIVDRHVCQLSRSLGLTEEIARTQLERLVRRHRDEWKAFLSSLGQRSFVAQWASRA
jgi:hypothetical protein